MKWLTAPIKTVAPPQSSPEKFSANEELWHITLDQIESGTGNSLKKVYKPLSEASTSTFVFDQENVLYSKLRPYLNKVIRPSECGVSTTELIPLRPKPNLLEPDYLVYFLRSPAFVQFASHNVAGTKMPRVIMDAFWEYRMPLPPLTEQRRIVEILDQADHLRKLRAEADKKAERILPALFNKMFGDTATNSMGWEEKPLRQVIAKVEAGWSSVSEPRKCSNEEFGVLKVSAVTSGRFLSCEHKVVLDLQTDKELITPHRGDFLFSRANTRELVAASCVVEDDHPNLFLPDKLWRLILHPDQATAMYLKELFWTNGFRDKFRASASGSSGSMLNISQEAMLNTVAPLPPIEFQEEFSATAWSLAAIAKVRRQAGESLDTLWTTLLQRAFSGDLTATWREAHMKELLAEMEQQAKYLN